MRALRATLPALLADDERPVGLATLVAVRGSAPRGPGAAMVLSADGEVVGNVSGGCVESAVVEALREVMAGGPARLLSFGYSDEDALAVGLTCGGEIDVFVEAPAGARREPLRAALARIDQDLPVAVATMVTGPAVGALLAVTPGEAVGTLGAEGLDAAVAEDARGLLTMGETALLRYGARGQRRMEEVAVLVESIAPRPRMIVFGAIDYAAEVARIGRFLGYRVTVCDPRETFATARRIPDADEIVTEWPHRYLEGADVDARTVLCVLTHDPKFDTPLLQRALRTPAAYIGVMGSRRTHERRRADLRELGVTEEELARLRAPIGLDLGARTPAETAVAVAAEIVASRWDGTGRPLRETEGRIHAGQPEALARLRE
jgi:xanthine dehydrogenase accessory factor